MRPNIVVIMTDDQTAASMTVLPKTNQLLGGEGVTFSNSIVTRSQCGPSRATFLTGQYTQNHRVLGNLPPHGGYAAFKHQDTTFPVSLQRAGYDTIHIGKYLNGYGRPPLEVPPGWTEFLGSIDPSTYRYSGFSLNVNGVPTEYSTDASGYQTDVYAGLASSAIRARKGSGLPFFLNIAFLAPHVQSEKGAGQNDASAVAQAVPAPRHVGHFDAQPLPEPPSFDEPDVSDKPLFVQDLPRFTPAVRTAMTNAHRQYLASLLAVDDAVERIIDTLQEAGELDNTVVIFTSDNGFFRGEHRIPAGKLRFYEPSIRVPLSLRGPGIPSGVTRRRLVANIDLAPTILDLASAEPLRDMDGQSLLPVLTDDEAMEPRAILLEAGGPFSTDRGVRTERYLYVEHNTGERELYDVVADPHQLQNRAGDPSMATVQADLAQRLNELRRRPTGAPN